MFQKFTTELEERLLRYTAINSQSDASSFSSPSSDIQFDMLNLLVKELQEIGIQDVRLTDYGTVLATLPGTAPGPTVCFLAHVDTTQQFNATDVKPRVVRSYDGKDIAYPDNPNLALSPAASPYLAGKVGDNIVTASGTTLLGADDKAGVAIIMTLARHIMAGSRIDHPPIRIALTPDEEIGRGVHPKLIDDLKADFGYTLDGGELGRIDYDSFSADMADITVTGVSIHPGKAKGKLVNAIHLASRIIETLPKATMTPDLTEDKEGFVHAVEMTGNAAEMKLQIILRDFELEGLVAKGEMVTQLCKAVALTEPRAKIDCTIRHQYRNMRYVLDNDMTPVTLAQDAMRSIGVEPLSIPMRGGTDGARLTEQGIPTPNLFTGMQNIHGPLEWISIQDMANATAVCLALIENVAIPGKQT